MNCVDSLEETCRIYFEALVRIKDQEHDPDCRFRCAPREECPSCPSAARIAAAALLEAGVG